MRACVCCRVLSCVCVPHTNPDTTNNQLRSLLSITPTLSNPNRAEYLSKFIPAPSPSVPSVCSTLVERAAGRLLMLWVRSACLLRPLGGEGKLQLAKDLGELQMVVGQGLFPLDALGPAHRCVLVLVCVVWVCWCVCVCVGRGNTLLPMRLTAMWVVEQLFRSLAWLACGMQAGGTESVLRGVQGMVLSRAACQSVTLRMLFAGFFSIACTLTTTLLVCHLICCMTLSTNCCWLLQVPACAACAAVHRGQRPVDGSLPAGHASWARAAALLLKVYTLRDGWW